MIRVLSYLIFVGAVIAVIGVLHASALLSQERPASRERQRPELVPGDDSKKKKLQTPNAKENGGKDKKKKLEKLKPGDVPPGPAGGAANEDPKKIMERIAENMLDLDKRLNIPDTGDDTRDIQQRILDDLDKLIKEQQRQQQKQQQGQPKTGQGKQKKSQSKGQQKQGKKTGKGAKKSGKSGKNSKGTKKSGKKSGMKKGGAPKAGKKNGKKTGKGAKNKGDKKNKNGTEGNSKKVEDPKAKNTVADLFKIKKIWGHLPDTKRLEMDAYSRERFMPRYDQILRQYYRSIAEQGRKQDE